MVISKAVQSCAASSTTCCTDGSLRPTSCSTRQCAQASVTKHVGCETHSSLPLPTHTATSDHDIPHAMSDMSFAASTIICAAAYCTCKVLSHHQKTPTGLNCLTCSLGYDKWHPEPRFATHKGTDLSNCTCFSITPSIISGAASSPNTLG